ncbi:MAG: hypothetical protein HQL11_02105, partial [Candidatus Omnitrophica bacterium]|nr:hypothetical protein [Candidatus Omnitrophota bacterium]
MAALLWIALLCPLASFAVLIFARGIPRSFAPLVAGGFSFLAMCANGVMIFLYAGRITPADTLIFEIPWIRAASLPVERFFGLPPAPLQDIWVGFLMDPKNLTMLTLVTVIGFLVQTFSAFYMAEEHDRRRYFAFLSLFTFSMTGLVISSNLLQLFMFWELVGLASY